MDTLLEKFAKLGCDNAPGQESRQKAAALELRGEKLEGTPVDFSHGDVDAHPPIPGTLADFVAGVEKIGGHQAYTEYRGGKSTREDLARKISAFTGAAIDPEENIILTPGTQGALFLAIGANMVPGDKVAIVEPDYFANRKLVEFFGGELCPIQMDYYGTQDQGRAGLDLTELEQAFQSGVKLFLFSNPNNPTGVIYSREEIVKIASLAKEYGATLIVDELYSRQVFDGRAYTHLCAQAERPDNLVTIIGPSKTESLSGYRLGVAFGSAAIIERMEKLQAIVSLRAPGYLLVRRAPGLDGAAGGRPPGHPGLPALQIPRLPRRHRPHHRGGELPVPQAAPPGRFRRGLCENPPGPRQRHRHPGHRVRPPVHRQLPHQFLPGPEGRRGGRGPDHHDD